MAARLAASCAHSGAAMDEAATSSAAYRRRFIGGIGLMVGQNGRGPRHLSGTGARALYSPAPSRVSHQDAGDSTTHAETKTQFHRDSVSLRDSVFIAVAVPADDARLVRGLITRTATSGHGFTE